MTNLVFCNLMTNLVFYKLLTNLLIFKCMTILQTHDYLFWYCANTWPFWKPITILKTHDNFISYTAWLFSKHDYFENTWVFFKHIMTILSSWKQTTRRQRNIKRFQCGDIETIFHSFIIHPSMRDCPLYPFCLF